MPWRWLRWTPWESIKIHSTVRFVSKNDNIGMNAWNDQRATRIIYFSLLENETKICLLDSKISLFLLEKKNAAAFFAASKKWYLEALDASNDLERSNTVAQGWRGGYRGDRVRAHRLNTTGSKETLLPSLRQDASLFFSTKLLPLRPPLPDRPTKFPLTLGNTNALLLLVSRIPSALENNTPPSLSYAPSISFRVFLFFPVLLFRAHSRGGRGIPSLPPLRIFSSGTKLVGQEGGGWIWLKFGWNRRSFWNCFDSGGK